MGALQAASQAATDISILTSTKACGGQETFTQTATAGSGVQAIDTHPDDWERG